MTTSQPERSRSSAAAPLWVIAILLVAVVVISGIYLLHRHNVYAERNKYRDDAEFYCTLSGNAPAAASARYLNTPEFKTCVEDRINVLVGEAHNS